MVSGVEFDEDKISYGAPASRPAGGASFGAPTAYGQPRYASQRSSGMAGWLIAHGWAKSDRAAQGIMIGVVIINIIITYIVITYFL